MVAYSAEKMVESKVGSMVEWRVVEKVGKMAGHLVELMVEC